MDQRTSDLDQEISALAPWFHNLHLPDGRQTAPDHFLGDFPRYKWEEIAAVLPLDLTGWEALDVGCNAGFYSIELARRGATVTAIDANEHYLRQARWAAAHYGVADRIDFRRMQVYELGRRARRYDLVLFLGVFYHLRYPLLGLDAVTRCVRKLMVFQSLTMPGEEVAPRVPDLPFEPRDALLDAGWPKLAFIEDKLAHDRTNWWAPNQAAMQALLRSSGMRVIGCPGKETYLCEPDPDNPSCVEGWDNDEYAAALGLQRDF